MHDFTIFDLGGVLAVGWVLVKVLGRSLAPSRSDSRVWFRAPPPPTPPAELPRVRTPV